MPLRELLGGLSDVVVSGRITWKPSSVLHSITMTRGDIMSAEKFFIIPHYDRYEISRSMKVRERATGLSLAQYPKHNPHVLIDGIAVSVAKLYVLTFYGDGPFRIIKDARKFYAYLVPDMITECGNGRIQMNDVEFRQIPGFSRYYIAQSGLIFDRKRNRFVSRTYNHGDYLVASILDDTGFRSPRKVHRLVYMTYFGPIPPNMTVDHKDNSRWNCDASNLQLLTSKDNALKAFRESASVARWSDDEIHTICAMLEAGKSNRDIASAIGYDYDADRKTLNHFIFMIRHGRVHSDIAFRYDIKEYMGTINRPDHKLNTSDIDTVRKMLADGIQVIDIARKYGCSSSTIRKIRDGLTWKMNDTILTEKVQRLSKG